LHFPEVRLPFSIPLLNFLRFFYIEKYIVVINVRDMVMYKLLVVPQAPAAENAQALILLVIPSNE
jgi:hypothetical protein